MGGGGDDGGYAQRQAEADQRKAQARRELNALFGVAPDGFVPFVGPRSPVADAGAAPGLMPTPRADDGPGGLLGRLLRDGRRKVEARDAPEVERLGASAMANKSALDALYAGVRQNAFDAGRRRLDEQRGTAARDLKFELFARGLDGGSVDVDQNALVGRVYGQGLTDLGARADATATQLRTGDEQTRVSLLQSIDNGMDQGSAISSALTQMRNNADRATAEATGTSLGDLFADAGLLYQRGRRAQGEQTAIEMARQAGLRNPSRTPISVSRGTTTFAG